MSTTVRQSIHPVLETELPTTDRPVLRDLIGDLATSYGRADHPELLRTAGRLGHLLPERTREALSALHFQDGPAAVVVHGSPVGTPVPATPRHWRDRDPAGTLHHDLWLVLVAAQLGDPTCWSTLQDGRLLADVLPIRGEEEAQTGHGSESELLFHVEDAFHDERCDILALLTLRNPDRIPTTIATADHLPLPDRLVEALFQPRFLILPDPEHLRTTDDPEHALPHLRAVLYGSPDTPYLRADPAFTRPQPGDREAAEAFEALCRHLQAGLVDVPAEPGDLLLLDNHRAVHGRRPFRARYDGTDRWLRKVTTVRDLRRTRDRRTAAGPRVLAPF
ncbi:TauD/TfdA family dioxygenase [Kitasatospora sp. NPDC096147]|uniref:TauD/TfdA family dioxygenase n=1 Tax=Kitasatospora sp. NPDC096147 TaxID=3364093 RepID=UPI0038115A17